MGWVQGRGYLRHLAPDLRTFFSWLALQRAAPVPHSLSTGAHNALLTMHTRLGRDEPVTSPSPVVLTPSVCWTARAHTQHIHTHAHMHTHMCAHAHAPGEEVTSSSLSSAAACPSGRRISASVPESAPLSHSPSLSSGSAVLAACVRMGAGLPGCGAAEREGTGLHITSTSPCSEQAARCLPPACAGRGCESAVVMLPLSEEGLSARAAAPCLARQSHVNESGTGDAACGVPALRTCSSTCRSCCCCCCCCRPPPTV